MKERTINMFKTGTLVMTQGIKAETDRNPIFIKEILTALDRYKANDWGDLSDNDKEANEEALKYGDRIFAAYNTTKGKIYIITEWDRSATTVLFASEY